MKGVKDDHTRRLKIAIRILREMLEDGPQLADIAMKDMVRLLGTHGFKDAGELAREAVGELGVVISLPTA